jgi:hypothetical protein
MGYYAADDIPYHWWLAENFALCDNYVCSVLGPTWPNRDYLLTGKIQNQPQYTNNPGSYTSAPSWTTYAQTLTDNGITWRVYNARAAAVHLHLFPHVHRSQATFGSGEQVLSVLATFQVDVTVTAQAELQVTVSPGLQCAALVAGIGQRYERGGPPVTRTEENAILAPLTACATRTS